MCGDYNLRREKRYVEVDVRFTPDGKIRPLAINYDKSSHSMESTVSWLSGVAHRALAGRGSASPA